MSRLLRALTLASALLGAGVARADTTGRITVMDDYTMMTGPKATIDAVLLRIYLRSEQIGGKDRSFVIDARSDLPAIATAGSEPWSNMGEHYPFSNRCRGLIDPNGKCQDVPIRNVTLGQMQELAGVHDLYYMIGGMREGQSAISIGRKTIYEAGLATVDGITFEKTFSPPVRVGVFGGLAPEPYYLNVTPDYQAAGAYLSVVKPRALARIAVTGQGYKFKADRATIFTQDFAQLSRGLTAGLFGQFDLIPGPQDRLIYADLAYSPTSRYGLKILLTRFRPVAFQESPNLFIQNVDPGLVAAWIANSGLAGTFGHPELLDKEDWTKAVNSGKATFHYVTATSFTPYVSAEYRQRDLDPKSGIVGTLGVYTYDPHDTGFIGRAFLQYESGFDFTAERIDAHLDKTLTDVVTAGGGLDIVQAAYQTRIATLETNYTKTARTIGLDGHLRYDKGAGLSFSLEVQAFQQSIDKGGPANAPQKIEKGYLETSALLGLTYRFGTTAPGQ
jgi:hypothetical protein